MDTFQQCIISLHLLDRTTSLLIWYGCIIWAVTILKGHNNNQPGGPCCLNTKKKTIRSTRNNAIRIMSFALISFILHIHYLTWYLTFTCILIVLQILYQRLNLFLLYLFLFVHSLFFTSCTFIVFIMFWFLYSLFYCTFVYFIPLTSQQWLQ